MEIEYIPEQPISIYALRCPLSKDIKYVGASYNVELRFKSHLSEKHTNKAKQEWLLDLKSKGLTPYYEILETVNTRPEAVEAELFYIEKYRDTILNGSANFKLPSEISNSKKDKYKISFYLTEEQTLKVYEVLDQESYSLDYSFLQIIKDRNVPNGYPHRNTPKWINTPDDKKII